MARRFLILLALVAVAGCGAGGGGATPSLSQARKDLADAPPALAGLHAQANEVLSGDADAVRGRLAALRGHPVVVNKWASWCGPCRLEFPAFQRVSVKLGKEVAFLGIDARDTTSAARRFLREHPLSYPSYADPREQTAAALKAPIGFPITNFYNRQGVLVFQHAGPFPDDAALEAAVRRYALGS